MAFPIEQVQSISSQVFHATENVTSMFVIPLALVRITVANVTGSSQGEYFSTLKGVVIYFVLAHSFDWLLSVLLTFPSHFAPTLSSINSGIGRAHADGIGVIPLSLRWVMESLIACLYFIGVFLNFAVTVLLSAMAPIIFLLCAVFSIGLGVKAFFALLIVVSSWPVIFAACGELHALALPLTGGNSFGVMMFDVITSVFKILGPLSMSYFGMQSAPAQAISSSMGGLVRAPGNGVKGGKATWKGGKFVYGRSIRVYDKIKGRNKCTTRPTPNDVSGKSRLPSKPVPVSRDTSASDPSTRAPSTRDTSERKGES